MQLIPHTLGNALEIKTRDVTVHVAKNVTIGNFALPGPGEYEVAGIMAEALPTHTRLNVEDLEVGYVHPGVTKLTPHDLEQLGAVSLLLLPVGEGAWPVKETSSLISQVDVPVVVLLPTEDSAMEGVKTTGVPIEHLTTTWKVTRASLPVDENKVIALVKE